LWNVFLRCELWYVFHLFFLNLFSFFVRKFPFLCIEILPIWQSHCWWKGSFHEVVVLCYLLSSKLELVKLHVINVLSIVPVTIIGVGCMDVEGINKKPFCYTQTFWMCYGYMSGCCVQLDSLEFKRNGTRVKVCFWVCIYFNIEN